MKAFFRWSALALLLVPVHCATTGQDSLYEVSYDYDIESDFNRYSRYKWMPLPVTARTDALDAKRIKFAVDSVLQTKGLTQSSQEPDFLIVTQIDSLRKINTTGWWSEFGFYDEGRLNLVFIDSKSQQIIWKGETRAKIKPNLSPQEKDQLINEAVHNLLNNYPPPAGKTN